MPNPPSKRGKARPKKIRNLNPPEQQIVYRGPTKVPRALAEISTITTYVSWAPTLVTSSGSGLANPVFSDDISTANDYSSFSPVWDEYRVLALEVQYQPYNRYNQTLSVTHATDVAPGFVLIDRDDGTATASLALASNYESARFVNLSSPFKCSVKMAGVEDAGYLTTTSTVARQWIKYYFEALGASHSYGLVHQFALVQFRGRN